MLSLKKIWFLIFGLASSVPEMHHTLVRLFRREQKRPSPRPDGAVPGAFRRLVQTHSGLCLRNVPRAPAPRDLKAICNRDSPESRSTARSRHGPVRASSSSALCVLTGQRCCTHTGMHEYTHMSVHACVCAHLWPCGREHIYIDGQEQTRNTVATSQRLVRCDTGDAGACGEPIPTEEKRRSHTKQHNTPALALPPSPWPAWLRARSNAD